MWSIIYSSNSTSFHKKKRVEGEIVGSKLIVFMCNLPIKSKPMGVCMFVFEYAHVCVFAGAGAGAGAVPEFFFIFMQ